MDIFLYQSYIKLQDEWRHNLGQGFTRHFELNEAMTESPYCLNRKILL